MTRGEDRKPDAGASGNGLRILLPVVAPLVFFAVFELLLAIVGFGGRPALFVDSENLAGMREANPSVIQRYFPGRDTKLGIDPIPFHATKPEGTLRLVVQGGSSAAGFPFGRWAGLAGMLGDRLEGQYPENEIEVISTAMAAVNSYTLLDFVDEIIDIAPDAVLIYAGHNEYLGIFGAGSALTAERSRGATLTHLKLSRFRVYQLLEMLYMAAKGEGAAGPTGEDGKQAPSTLMAHAASSAEIPLDSATYRAGLEQFEGNLSQILEAYRDAGIPVFVATLASNERNQRPFAGAVSEAVIDEAKALLQGVGALRAKGDLAGARARLKAALALDETAANTWFGLAQVEEALGNGDAAREAYRSAKEFDRLRFRAPQVFNDAVRRLAGEFDAVVVDVAGHLAARSPLGVVGYEMMLEHLHPNSEGYFWLSDAFYNALIASDLLTGRSARISTERALRDMPITAVDRVLAAQAVREIRGDFPFRADRIEVPFPAPRNQIDQLAMHVHKDPTTWINAMESLMQLHLRAGQQRDAAVVARVTAHTLAWEQAPNYAAASMLVKLDEHRRALKYLARSRSASPSHAPTLQLEVEIYRYLEEDGNARAALVRLIEVVPRHPWAGELVD
ncbi:MAG: tetratricopeptide (TPR) repeat protein [Myxococcota bacterium]|jgi:tetratricopeptide (TPR) repeat protein